MNVMLFLLLWTAIFGVVHSDMRVTNFQPKWGSINGATRISIFGDFVINPFNTVVGEETPETKVIFSSEFSSYECDVEKDSTHETQISCYTRPMPKGNYRLCPEVGGEQLDCFGSSFGVVDWRTPYIHYLTFTNGSENVFAGLPRSLLTVEGRIYTNIYGPNDENFLVTGNEVSLRRAYAGSEDCSMIVDGSTDELYGITFIPPESTWYGKFTCKMLSEYVGNNNFSFIVTDYGRSDQALNLMRVSADDRLYMFQTYAEITGISPQSGSQIGGTTITISGNFFDPFPSVPTEVYVGRQPCTVILDSVIENEIQCVTTQEPDPIPVFPGSRGVVVEMWNEQSSSDLDTQRIKLNSTFANYSTWHQDAAGYTFLETLTTVKMTGLFEAPGDDKYQFYIRSDDKSVLYVSCDGDPANAVKVAEAPVYSPRWTIRTVQRSQFMELKKGQLCYYDAMAVNWYGPGNLYVGVLRATTTLNQAQSSNVFDERQYLRWHASEKKDNQTLTFVNWTSAATVYDVQEVQVISECSLPNFCVDGYYTLVYRDSETKPLSHNAAPHEFAEALESVLIENTDITVTSQLTVNGNISTHIYTVTFESDLGMEPLLQVSYEGADVSVSVQKIEDGSPSFDSFALEIMGRTTSILPFGASATQVGDALTEISGAKCAPELLGIVPYYKEALDYEGPVPDDYTESGKRVSDTEAFCGKQSLLNPKNVFDHARDHFKKYQVALYPRFCFAHKGQLESRIRVAYEYTNGDGNTVTRSSYIFQDLVPVLDEWSYECYNIHEAIAELYPDALNIHILQLGGFSRVNNLGDFYIDTIMITSQSFDSLQDLLDQRKSPAMHQGKLMTFEVEKLFDDVPEYHIIISPLNCAYDLPLISVRNAMDYVFSDPDSVFTRASNWPNDTEVHVIRSERTNMPMAGTFDLTYEDDEFGNISLTDIPADISKTDLESLLETLRGFGDIRVDYSADKCYSRRFIINWVSNGGDKNPFTVNVTKITGDEDLTFLFIELVDGGALYGPVSGDMGRELKDKPQVEVRMNGIQSICSGDCSFAFSSDMTPEIVSATPTEGTRPTNITITGTFDALDDGSKVIINGESCVIYAQTLSTISCTTGNMEFGEHKIEVLVGGKGYARHPMLSVNYTQMIEATNFFPTQSYQTGGVVLTVDGYGFGNDAAITIGNNICPIVELTKNQIQCMVPSSDAEGSFSIVIHTLSQTVTVGAFLYSNVGMPIVSAVSPVDIFGPGGDNIMIQGSGFGSTIEDIMIAIGGFHCELVSVSDTMIECTAPYLSSGVYTLEVMLSGRGLSDLEINSIPDISYYFAVTGVHPRKVSLFGGQEIVVTGVGFNDNITVTFGGNECTEITSSPTSLTCILGSTAENHIIQNTGIHPVQGKGYAWKPAVVSIKQGDTVTWKWKLNVLGSSILGIKVFETDEAASHDYNGGFMSGGRSLSGTFSHKFNKVGTKYFSTGYVDDERWGTILMHGAVHVQPFEDIEQQLELTSYGVAAEVNLAEVNLQEMMGTIGNSELDAKACVPLDEDITYDLCSESENLSNAGGIIASACRTPAITSIFPNYGTANDQITIIGNGFGDLSCRLDILIGEDITCDVDFSNDTTILCTPMPNDGAAIGVVNEVSLNVLGYGTAFVDIDSDSDRRFALLPVVDLVEPSKGSLAGGTSVTITGSGFMDDITIVDVNGYECEIYSLSYSEIVCTTSPGFEGQHPINVFVGSYLASCESVCEFHYQMASTPNVTSIDPNQVIAANTEITFLGEFLDETVEIFIDSSPCVTSFTNTTHIFCTISELKAGDHEVSVWFMESGFASFSGPSTIEGVALAMMSPGTGGTAGGTVATISGHGFNCDDLSVTIGLNEAEVISITNTEVQIMTPAGPDGATEVNINCDGEIYPEMSFTYDAGNTPTLLSVSPQSGTPGTEVIITGVLLSPNGVLSSVSIGDANCIITSESVTEIICDTTQPLSGGSMEITAMIGGVGYAESNLIFTYDVSVTSFSPTEGSFGGGTELIITGTGFTSSMSVMVGLSQCDITSASYTTITCVIETTPSITERDGSTVSFKTTIGATDITVFNSANTPEEYFSIGQAALACTDCASSVSTLKTVKPNDDVAAAAPTSFNEVFKDELVGISVWEPVSPSDSYVCLGNFMVSGLSAPDVSSVACVHYMLVEESTASLLADLGSLYMWEIGTTSFVVFTTSATSPTVSELRDMSQALPDLSAQVSVAYGEDSADSDTNYTFMSSHTPVVTSVSPSRGGTGGGTVLTISGSGFSDVLSDVTIDIDGSPCIVSTASLTSITCATESHEGSIKTAVIVSVAGKGQSLDAGAQFFYVDVWSSIWTWGARGVPGDGALVVIKEGQEIMIDTDTAILEMLLIQGGRVFFDEADIELHTKNILIVDGGKFEIGTEDEPFSHKAIITLHGHLRSIELPIYGTKTIAVRNGTLDLHGQYVPVTWTYLAQTEEAGSNVITVVNPVTWKAGDEIVIASTGDKHSQKENEKHTILSVAGDMVTITLNGTLAYRHLGEAETMTDGTVLETRAEVGLLTRNVVVRGSRNMDWSEKIPACPDGFNTGEFAQQTCFQGRFGEEMGSDQFGGQIMFHHPSQDEQNAFGRISYIELNYMGQAFRLGRYALHFHIMGDMEYKNYIRGCSIHESFNRAVTIHDTHKAIVEKNVIFNAMGGAVFIEDGIETGNILRENLVVFCRQSTSLQNEDITPAAFWITNPDNIVEDNAVAGGTHFGFWYRMHKFPSGPSHTTSICPRNVELGIFRNNTCHSQGWFGLWIFQEYTPKEGSRCGSTVNKIAEFNELVVWNCDKGAEFVQTGSVQIRNSMFFNNRFAGMEVKMMKPLVWGETGIFNSVIVGHSAVSGPNEQMGSGVVLPYSGGFLVKDSTFMNFNRDGGAVLSTTTITGTCAEHCGGFHSRFEGIQLYNTPNMGRFRWEHENYIEDVDGSLTSTGTPSVVIASTDTAPPSCIEKVEWSRGVHGGMVCPPLRLHRIAWNNAIPTSLQGSLVNLTNQYGVTQVPFEKKRMTLKPGWMALLFDGEVYDWTYHHLPKLANFTYNAKFFNYRPGECNIIRHTFTQTPDRFQIAPGQDKNSTDAPLDCSINYYGDYYFDSQTKELEYIVTGEPPSRKRSISFSEHMADINALTRDIDMNTFRCYYEDCTPPPDPNTLPPARERPSEFVFWSDVSIWDSGVLPVDNDNVTINSDLWVVADIDFPIIYNLRIEGVLEIDWEPLDDGLYKSFTLMVHNVFIAGGRLIVGWEENLFRGIMNIILTGNIDSEEYAIVQGVNMGAKAIGVFGGLDIHGVATTNWVKLGETALAGTNTLILQESVEWIAGNEIVVTTTGFDPWESETFSISSISGDGLTLTLNDSLLYQHTAKLYNVNGVEYEVRGEVGLLTRNIKIIGEEYEGSDQESFGGRIIVGHFVQDDAEFTGYARIEGAQFIRMGQEGYPDAADPRYALVYWRTGTQSVVKPSYVRDCSFSRNFNTAIGAFFANSIEFTSNVIHHTVGPGMVIEGIGNRIVNNLISLMINPGTYNGKTNFIWTWFGAVQTKGAATVYLSSNIVAGSERAAYWIRGEPCDDPQWGVNEARASLDGIYMNKFGQTECTLLRNFNIHHSYDFGIYYQDKSSVQIENMVITDSGVGIITLFNGPSSTTHTYADKFSRISSTTIVAVSEDTICPTLDSNLGYMQSSANGRAPRGGESRTVGIFGPSFMSAHNSAPKKPFAGLMQYPAIGGKMELHGVTFVKFRDNGCGATHIAFMPNPLNEDYQHPVYMSTMSVVDSLDENLIFYPRPSLGKINPSDCVDMECDAFKNMIVIDTDGTFFGTPRTIIPQAEYGWGTDLPRGLGDYRIPKTLLTYPNGSRIPVELIAPDKGILRSDTCEYNTNWQAYTCTDYQYQLFIIESLDSDSETRRLSPVALLSEGYLDLENGPQDHGWCAGYTCQLRLSTFFTTVAVGFKYTIHFSGTTPQELRVHLPNAASDEAIVACLYYFTSNRLDVYYHDSYVLPKNGYYSGAKVITRRPPDNEPDLYMPTVDDLPGTNYYDRGTQEICITIKGNEHVDIKISNAIFLNFGMPSVTEEEFFDDLITNLAALLQIPEDNIWIADVVREGSSRKRRGISTMNIEIGVGDPPSQESQVTPKVATRSNVTEDGEIIDIGEPDPETEEANKREEAERQSLELLASVVKDSIETGTISKELGGIDITSTAITEPMPPSSQPDWEEVAEQLEEGTVVTITVVQVGSIFIVTQPGQDNGRAMEPLILQPRLAFLDTNGQEISPGLPAAPWVVTASIYSGAPSATLIGTVGVEVIDGVAQFDDLGISLEGEYRLEFTVTTPVTADFSVISDCFNLRRPRIIGSCTDDEDDPALDREYFWEQENCSLLCLYDCYGENEQCSEMNSCGPHAACIAHECVCDEEYDFDIHNDENIADIFMAEITCETDFMEVRIDKCGANAIGFNLEKFSIFGEGPMPSDIADSSSMEKCKGQVVATENGVMYSFSIHGDLRQCNADVLETSTHIIYKNKVIGYKPVDNGIIIRDRPVEIEFNCHYHRNLLKSLEHAIHPFISAVSLELESEGEYNITMSMWEDPDYIVPVEEPAEIHVPDKVYIAVTAEGRTDSVVFLDECIATPDSDSELGIEYPLIENGCVSGNDVEITMMGGSNEARFNFESFNFMTGGADVYVQCEILLCVQDLDPCTPSCTEGRKRRDVEKKRLSLGPISIVAETSAQLHKND